MSEKPKKIRVYEKIAANHPQILAAVKTLGETVRANGPLEDKVALLIQLGAAAAGQSEGSVHSHTKRALDVGVSPAEIEHALLLLISVIGFPKVAAALSWAQDIIEDN